MRGTISAALVAAIAVTGCAADEMPDELGELALAVTGDTPAAAYRVVISDAAGKQLLERTIKPNQAGDSRFAAALPADVLLLVQVVALDGANTELGAGATLVRLVAGQRSQVAIDVVAFQTGGSAGILDAAISDAALPTRDYLYPDPAEATPGMDQALVARLADARTQQPVTDAAVVSAVGVVAPMFTPQPDGGLAAQWVWAQPQTSPASARVEVAYLDGAGRGWIASADATFADGVVMPIDFGWIGQVHASGLLGSDGRWLVGVVGPTDLRFRADPNADRDFDDAGESASFQLSANTRPIVFALTDPTQIVMPVDIAGAIFDQDGNGTLDTIATIGADGTIASASWPLK